MYWPQEDHLISELRRSMSRPPSRIHHPLVTGALCFLLGFCSAWQPLFGIPAGVALLALALYRKSRNS